MAGRASTTTATSGRGEGREGRMVADGWLSAMDPQPAATRRRGCPSADRRWRRCPAEYSLPSRRSALSLRCPWSMSILHPSSAWLFPSEGEAMATHCSGVRFTRTEAVAVLSFSLRSSAPPRRSTRCSPADQQAAAPSAARLSTRCRVQPNGRWATTTPLAVGPAPRWAARAWRRPQCGGRLPVPIAFLSMPQ